MPAARKETICSKAFCRRSWTTSSTRPALPSSAMKSSATPVLNMPRWRRGLSGRRARVIWRRPPYRAAVGGCRLGERFLIVLQRLRGGAAVHAGDGIGVARGRRRDALLRQRDAGGVAEMRVPLRRGGGAGGQQRGGDG